MKDRLIGKVVIPMKADDKDYQRYTEKIDMQLVMFETEGGIRVFATVGSSITEVNYLDLVLGVEELRKRVQTAPIDRLIESINQEAQANA